MYVGCGPVSAYERKDTMKIIRIEEMVQLVNPTPGKPHRLDLVTPEQRAKELGGFLSIVPAGGEVPYHFHEKRESLLFLVKGEAVEIVEGEEHPVKAGDVLYIPAGEKHQIVNRSDEDLRYLEFFTPLAEDFIIVE
jgi:quercetin dioxygenase-like cupin family protein